LGVKWNFRKASQGSALPALGASLYFEFPTRDPRQELGSGLTDYWLIFIAQKKLFDKTRVNGNIGFLFAGNTSTGVLGIQSTRGHVYTMGLSVLHEFSARLTLGVETYGGISDDRALGRDQLQAMVGGRYSIRDSLTLHFGLLIGKYIASPARLSSFRCGPLTGAGRKTCSPRRSHHVLSVKSPTVSLLHILLENCFQKSRHANFGNVLRFTFFIFQTQ
jgi:hypothetical protein